MKKIYLNTRLVPASQARVSVLDRGFLYGDGVYETVRVYAGRIFRAENHWKRLDGSLRGLRLSIPWSHSALTAICQKTIRGNGLQDCLVRVTISRGMGKIGYDPSNCGRPTLTVLASEIRPDLNQLWKNGVKIAIPSVRRNSLKSLSPALKHTNCLNGILAKIESLKSGAFEGVFLNLDGFLAEGTISNVFLIKKGVLWTPSLDCGILDGVTRAAVIETAKKAGYKVQETRLRPSELFAADEAFLTSTTMETMPIVKAGDKTIGRGKPGPVVRDLHLRLRALIRKELALPAAFVRAFEN